MRERILFDDNSLLNWGDYTAKVLVIQAGKWSLGQKTLSAQQEKEKDWAGLNQGNLHLWKN